MGETKTYFMSWQSDNKRGHSIADAHVSMPAREVLRQMIESVHDKFGSTLIGTVSAIQFNVVG